MRSVVAILLFASAASAATAELRGTWVTTTGLASSTSTVYSPAVTATNFARLRAIGLNSVYMDAWRNGATYFPSTTMQAFTGQSIASEAGRDVFGETLIQAHRNGMSQIAWLQYGFAAQFLQGAAPSNTLALKAQTNGWLLQNSSGSFSDSSNKYAWMNPLVPEVRGLLINMAVEMVKKYDLDGIQFDDRLAWPTQFGYDAYTKAKYLAETGKTVPASPTDAAFTTWRAAKITDFAKEFSIAIRSANPKVKVSATPGGYSDVYSTYAVDAGAWSTTTVTANGVTTPLFDEIVPQVYSSTSSGFTSTWNSQLGRLASASRATTGAGISINNSAGAPYDWATINKPQVDTQRASTGKLGHIWWYSDGVLNSDEAALTAYYNVAANGQAARPDRPANWRPAPIVATALGGTSWRAAVTSIDRYSVIAKSGTTWSEAFNTVLPTGTLALSVGSYANVELLVDRRGFIPADANFDFIVNQTDLSILMTNFNTSGKLWTAGDFTLDGSVNQADLDLLAANWGAGSPVTLPPLSSLLPEPCSVFVLCTATLCLRRRRPLL